MTDNRRHVQLETMSDIDMPSSSSSLSSSLYAIISDGYVKVYVELSISLGS